VLDGLVLTSRRNPGAVSISMDVLILILIRMESYVDCVLIESLRVTASGDEDPVTVLEGGLSN
jgi:hypothetical protein